MSRPLLPLVLAAALLTAGNLAAAEPGAAPPSLPAQLAGRVPASLTGNPAADNVLPGTGAAGRLLGLSPDSGLRLGGVWLGDTNVLLSGGAEPGTWSFNQALIVGANLDAEKLVGWSAASFGIQFLRFDGQDTNGQAGSVQGYNSLPGPLPRQRSELYQLWIRQAFFNERIVLRLGKMVPTTDFNNVARPVATSADLAVPAVTGLLYTPVFVNPTLLGAIGGYYNSVSGFTVSLAPTRNSYLRYGFFDGNVARGVQTGLMGPQFNGYWFHILEAGADWVLADRYPGNFGAGLWHQTGELDGPDGITQTNTGGFYLFGTQRIWTAPANLTPPDGKNSVAAPAPPASISAFTQFGANNARTLPANQFFGAGLTGFGLVPGRAQDSAGLGLAWSWLNPEIFDRPSELMFQGYYQAHVIAGTFLQPGVTYIPTPGASASLGGAWALTFRVTVLF